MVQHKQHIWGTFNILLTIVLMVRPIKGLFLSRFTPLRGNYFIFLKSETSYPELGKVITFVKKAKNVQGNIEIPW